MKFGNGNCRTRAIRSMRTLGAVTAALALSVATASAQTLSAPSLGNASSPNESSGSSANPSFQRFSATSTLSSGATSFATRYFGNASADCGPACGSRTETLSSNYTVSWTATAPNLYSLADRHPAHRRPHHRRRRQQRRPGHDGRPQLYAERRHGHLGRMYRRRSGRQHQRQFDRRERQPDQHAERLRPEPRVAGEPLGELRLDADCLLAVHRLHPDQHGRGGGPTRRQQPRRLERRGQLPRHRRPHAVERRSLRHGDPHQPLRQRRHRHLRRQQRAVRPGLRERLIRFLLHVGLHLQDGRDAMPGLRRRLRRRRVLRRLGDNCPADAVEPATPPSAVPRPASATSPRTAPAPALPVRPMPSSRQPPGAAPPPASATSPRTARVPAPPAPPMPRARPFAAAPRAYATSPSPATA